VAPAAGGQQGGQQGQQPQQGAASTLISTILRMGMMWYMFNAFKGPQGGAGGGGAGGAGGAVTLTPLHARGTPLDVRFYLSERAELADDGKDGKDTLIWQVDGVPLGTLPEHKHTYMYTPSEAVKSQNASVWLHAQVALAGVDPAVRDELPPGSVFVKSVSLVRYMPKPKNKTGVNLLSSDGPSAPVTTPKVRVVVCSCCLCIRVLGGGGGKFGCGDCLLLRLLLQDVCTHNRLTSLH
jgi:GTPase involved in cell partitioning and DNA repair